MCCHWSSHPSVKFFNIHTVRSFVCLFFIERNRRSGRQHPMSTRRMVALYDYDPRESSPNVDVEVPSSCGFSYSPFFCSILCVHHHVDKSSQSTTYSLHILSGRYSVCRCVTSKCKESVSHFGSFANLPCCLVK